MNSSSLKWCTSALTVAALALGVTGCMAKSQQDPAPVVSQDAFIERFDAVCDDESFIPLSSLTTVGWDRVSIFPEGTSAEKYEAETGNKAVYWGAYGSRTPAESLMVLQNEGEVVELLVFLPAKIKGSSEHPSFSYEADVLVKMNKTNDGCFGELMPALANK